MKTRDASCVMTISRREEFEFRISGFKRHNRALETGKCSVI